MKKANKIVWGIVLIAAGLLFGINALGLAQVDIFFDGYYYDEANDEEWLYATFYHGERLLELLEETDDPRSMAMRKELSKKDDINPILVMVRLKK